MVQPCLPELITALHDSDARVRGLAAQAIGEIGPMAVSAVPGLVLLLADPDEGSRDSACIGLAGIGPAARDALPALRRALSDASPNVRRFAQRAIDRIDVR
jgi:HEAT repeat protein